MSKCALIHVCPELKRLKNNLMVLRKNGFKQNFFETVDGRLLSYKEAFALINQYEKSGYSHFPGCNKTNTQGICQGHSE